jgi:hypothetical protein
MKTPTLLFLFVLAGCTATPRPTVVRIIQERPPASRQPWSDGEAATYWLGRTAVGRDGTVLHEAHPVYRLENASLPQLATPPEFFFPTNVPIPLTNAAFEQFELLRAETARARDLTLQLARASESLAQQAGAMKSTAESTRQLQDQLRQLLAVCATLSNRVQILEQHLSPASAPKNPASRSTNGL